jgi:hypothetical protein
MDTPTESNLDRTKKFVKKYQTPLACIATAVVVRQVTLSTVLAGTKTVIYEIGRQAGEKEAALSDAFTFIKANGQWDEFLATAKQLRS